LSVVYNMLDGWCSVWGMVGHGAIIWVTVVGVEGVAGVIPW